MTIKQIEFTHDIEKPHLSPNHKNSLNRSKAQDQYDINNFEDDGPDLIRRRLSSDDEEYQLRMQNAAASMAERERMIAENQRLAAEDKQRRKELNKLRHQQNDHNQPDISINHHYRPVPPNRKMSVPLRRPIPMGSHHKPNNNNDSDPGHISRFRPQPPGTPKSPILPVNPNVNKQIKNDSLVHVNNLTFDDYSYSSYAESIDSDSSSSEFNLNMHHPSNDNENVSKASNSNSNDNQDESKIDQHSNTNQTSNSNENDAQIFNPEPAATPIAHSVKEKYFYRLEKSTISRIPKKKKKFSFFLGNKALIEVTYVKKQKNIQFQAYDSITKTDKTYTLLIGNQKSSFSLRNGSIYDNEIFSMRVVDEKKQFHYHSVFLNSFVNLENFPNKLINQEPTCDMESPESPAIIFGLRSNTIIPSKSNWLFKSPENEELVAVMKGSKSIIYIESIPSVITPIIFTIALVAFIGNPNTKP